MITLLYCLRDESNTLLQVDKVKAEEKPSEVDLIKQEEVAEKSVESSADELPEGGDESELQLIKEGEVEYVKVLVFSEISQRTLIMCR